MDSGVGHQVGLELGEVDVEGTVKAEGGGDGGDNLADQPVQVGVGWSLDVQVPPGDVVDGLIVHHEGTVGVLKGSVEDEESLEPGALVRQLPDPVQDQVDHLLADGVVASCVVVRRILLAVDQLLRVVESAVGSATSLVNDSWLKINEDGPWDVLPGSGLGEEGLEGVVAKGLVRGHVAVRLNAMLEAVELLAGVANLATGLPDVDGDALAHFG